MNSVRSSIKRQFLKFNQLSSCKRMKNYRHDLDTNETTTLTGRMLLYMDKNGASNVFKTKELLLKRYPRDFKTLSTKQMESLFDEDLSKSITLHTDRFVSFDNECYKLLNQLDHEDVLNLLKLYVKVVPDRITEYRFYKESMLKLYERLDFMVKNDLLRFIFYLGLQKNERRAQQMFNAAFNKLKGETFNLEETCIVCNAAFKLAVKLRDRRFLQSVSDTISGNLSVLQDPALFVTLIKTLRHNRCQDEDLLNTIACTILFNRTCDNYSFVAVCHILALYADYAYYNRQLFDVLYNVAYDRMRRDFGTSKDRYLHPTERIRVKDLRTFLWSTVNLCYNIGDENVETIVEELRRRKNCGEYEEHVDCLVESLLYLWIIDWKVKDLLKYALTRENVALIHALESRTKQRLNVLLNLIQLEDATFYKELNVRPLMNPKHNSQSQLATRPTLKRIKTILSTLEERFDVKFKFSYELPHLNVLGITGYKRDTYKTVFVEVIDDTVQLKNVVVDDQLCMNDIVKSTNGVAVNGFMRVKLRLLDKMDEALLVIEEDEVNQMTDRELQSYLDDELSLLT